MKTTAFLLTIASVCLLGCRHSESDSEFANPKPFINKGEFLVAADSRPLRIVEIADALEQFPHDPSKREFDSVLTSARLNVESDWYKDERHMWYFDSGFASTIPADASYLVTIDYWCHPSSTINLFNAAIHIQQPHAEMLWHIDYNKVMGETSPFQ